MYRWCVVMCAGVVGGVAAVVLGGSGFAGVIVAGIVGVGGDDVDVDVDGVVVDGVCSGVSVGVVV